MSEYGLNIEIHAESNEGPPIEGATVVFTHVATTDALGHAVVDRLLVTVRKEGYEDCVDQPYDLQPIGVPTPIAMRKRTASQAGAFEPPAAPAQASAQAAQTPSGPPATVQSSSGGGSTGHASTASSSSVPATPEASASTSSSASPPAASTTASPASAGLSRPDTPQTTPPASGGQEPPDGIDLRQATIHNSPDVSTWPATAKLTQLALTPLGVHLEFTKKDGAGRWPDVTPPGWEGSLQYTLWIVLNISGQWHTSGCIEFWHECDRNGGPPERYAADWYYDPNRWAPMSGHQPAVGERVGFFVTAGDARNNGPISVKERSNIVVVPFPDAGGATFSF